MGDAGPDIAGPEGGKAELAQKSPAIIFPEGLPLLLCGMAFAQIALQEHFPEQTLTTGFLAGTDQVFGIGRFHPQQINGQGRKFREEDTGTQTADFRQSPLHLGVMTIVVEPDGPVAQMSPSPISMK